MIVDGIIGPWFLEPWLNIVREGYEVHYIVLRANKEEIMWEQFNNLGAYEKNILDTTRLSVEDTVSAIKEKVTINKLQIKRPYFLNRFKTGNTIFSLSGI